VLERRYPGLTHSKVRNTSLCKDNFHTERVAQVYEWRARTEITVNLGLCRLITLLLFHASISLMDMHTFNLPTSVERYI